MVRPMIRADYVTKGEVFDTLDEMKRIVTESLDLPEFAGFKEKWVRLVDTFKDKVADYQPGDSMAMFEAEVKELFDKFRCHLGARGDEPADDNIEAGQ